jgi:hypothetical protein
LLASVGQRFLASFPFARLALRDSEVHQHRFRFVPENIARLHITVDDAVFMGVRERVEEITTQLPDFCGWKWAAEDSGRDRIADEVLHRVKGKFPSFVGVEDLHDVVVLQIGEGPGLTYKPRNRGRRVELRPNHFDRYETVEAALTGEDDDTHAAVTQLVVAFEPVTLLCESGTHPLEEGGHVMAGSELPGSATESQTVTLAPSA